MAVVVVSLTGCKAKLGKTCSPEGKEVCAGKAQALVCSNGKWASMACRGAQGCDGEGTLVSCDQSVARVGELCDLEGGTSCAEDKKSSLRCTSDAWVVDEICGGPLGCSATGQQASCDTSLAREGDKCARSGSQSCSQDGRTRMHCQAGRMQTAEHCRGPQGCAVNQGKVSCDNSLALVGEPCDTADNYACNTDFRTVLVCRGGKYVIDEKCSSTKSCRVVGSRVGCIE